MQEKVSEYKQVNSKGDLGVQLEIPGPASPGNSLEMQLLDPTPEIPRRGSSNLDFTKILG